VTDSPPLIVLAGATATGKTELAIRLAESIVASGRPAAVISADSRQVFRGLDIGTAKASVSWNDVSWNDVSWNDAAFSAVSWGDVSWNDVSWATISWNDVSWNDVSWADVSWADTSQEDAAEGDENGGDGYALTPADAAAIMANPDIAPDPTTLPCDPTTEGCTSDGGDTGSSGGASSP
jgi:hypothetical protein